MLGQENDNPSDADLADINMIPLIDVMLVLLITFMIAAPLSIRGIHVELPATKGGGSSVTEEKLVLAIDKTGAYFIDKVSITEEALEKHLAGIFAVRHDKSLFIRADTEAKHGSVVHAMATAKIAGVKRISVLTQRLQ